MKLSLSTLAILASSAYAAPQKESAASNAGQATSNAFPPSGTEANTSLFPDESVVGFPGPTATGIEPDAIQTAPAYPYNTQAAYKFPLVVTGAYGQNSSSSSNISKYWGNLTPWYSVSSADYGLPNASPLIPEGCTINQVQLLYRHGARYPTSGSAPQTFAGKVANATKNGGFAVSGNLQFLANWTYGLGAELLTPFGRSQNFQLGVEYRQLYGELLNNFTAQKAIPVFRTESQDRMVKTALNFAAGFFGIPEYQEQVNIEILVETPNVNNSGAPYETCTNSNVASRGSIGSTLATKFANNAFNSTISRLNSLVSGNLTFNPTDAIAMLQLCAYETDAFGYSAFCGLFTQQDFANFEYYYDLSFYYNNGPGSPVAAAQGKGYLQEFVARMTQSFPTASSALNETYDNSSTYFPLNQSIYADATHEVVVLDTLTAFNLSGLWNGPALNPKQNDGQNTFVASKVVPFATHFTVQVLECPAMSPSKQIRFLVNDAVVPISGSYAGCPQNENGLCSFSTVVSALQKRITEIDYNYACFANYTATVGVNSNGLPPAQNRTS